MTRHSLHSIAAIVARAGFKGSNIPAAVAIAMHESQGDDAYDYLACIDPLIHDRGIFALHVGEFAPADHMKLFNPQYSADYFRIKYQGVGISLLEHRAAPVALHPDNLSEIVRALRSTTPTHPIEPHSKLAQVAYTHRI